MMDDTKFYESIRNMASALRESDDIVVCYSKIIEHCGVPEEWMHVPYFIGGVFQQNIPFSWVIYYLNDYAKLSFKQIADYLEITYIPE